MIHRITLRRWLAGGPLWPGNCCDAIRLTALRLQLRRVLAPHLWNSLRAGGCTFAEDPAHSCAEVTPIWSAAVDPCVLRVCAEPATPGAPSFNLNHSRATIRSDAGIEYIVGPGWRLDVICGTAASGPVTLTPMIDLAREIEPQLLSVRRLPAVMQGSVIAHVPDGRFRKWVEALRAIDARAAGASLRDIGLHLIGGDDWPGDGEHLKSRARRLVQTAKALQLAGPAWVLAQCT